MLRLNREDEPHVLGVLRGLLPLLETETLTGQLWIFDERRARVQFERFARGAARFGV